MEATRLLSRCAFDARDQGPPFKIRSDLLHLFHGLLDLLQLRGDGVLRVRGGDGGPEARARDGRRTSRRAGAPGSGEFERGTTEYCGAAGIA